MPNDDLSYEDVKTRWERIRVVGAPFIVVATMAAYFAAPVLRFEDPVWFGLSGGLFAGLVFAFVSFTMLRSRPEKRPDLIVWGLIGAAGLLIVLYGLGAQRAKRFEYQCALLEKDMQLIHHARPDSLELFHAMDCPYQGVGTLRFRKSLP